MSELAEKQWYIATTYSGHEQKVADNIKKRVESMNLSDYVFRIVVAEEEIPVLNKDGSQAYVEKNGIKTPKVKIKNLYPGYVFVEMIMTDDSWYMVRNTPGVTGIAGSSGGGQKPTPVSPKEMETVLKRMGMVDNTMYENYHVGDMIKIIHGTFANVDGKIISIDKDAGTVRVETVFFGRVTPVDVEFSEIIRQS
ncbi:MAG TPA: transcription termination/antitermination factor NusG [Firmicutes bacterium]|nr:transcription termination/antitermination factor NusG [Bacillota bacterium]